MNPVKVSGEPDRQIIAPALAVHAMRDSGYRNTACALAELIDNSVQAKATDVDVLCLEERRVVKERSHKQITHIGVLDNGEGMSPGTLLKALQFGNGTRLDDRSGIGRFGMGLPNSSISQCRFVEIWTWQAGPNNAVYSYLDVDQIESGKLSEVPEPETKDLPEKWRVLTEDLGLSGTLVVWSRFDYHRLTWRGSAATFKNTERLIGRIYRKFIDEGDLTIRLRAWENDTKGPTINENVRVNDPLYLMGNSTTPDPFDQEPMFQPWGKDGCETFSINYNGRECDVSVRISWAKPETVPSDKKDRGGMAYGKHAAKNLGVSIVRAKRELELDDSWAGSYDPTERWWGVEVEFPPVLDEVFGVTNNKQNATIFSQMANFDWKTEAQEGESESDFQERMTEEGNPKGLLLPITNHIKTQLTGVRKRLKDQTKNKRSKTKRHDEPGVADRATSKCRERAEQGHEIPADKEEFMTADQVSLKRDLIEVKHYPEDVAEKISNAVLNRKLKMEFLTASLDGDAFFKVERHHGGLTAIVFNTEHPFHHQLIEALELKTDDKSNEALSKEDLIQRIHRSADTVELLFAAWARYETEEINFEEILFRMRQDWGKMARFFLKDEAT